MTPIRIPPAGARAAFANFIQDLRYATRGLRAKPGFTLAVVVTLGLGIGANAAMFSIVDGLLFRPPAFLRDPGLTHRVYLAQTSGLGNRSQTGTSSTVQYARYRDFTNWTASFTRLAEFTRENLAIGVGTEAREMSVGVVSASFFGFFDAPPALGRYFSAAEDATPDGTPVAVLGYGYWQTRYGGRREALGETLQIGSTIYTIVGVTPAGFTGLWPDQPPAAYIPITTFGSVLARGLSFGGDSWWTTYHWVWASMIAQRKPGVSVAAASADLTNAYIRSYAAQRATSTRMTPIEQAKPHVLIGSVLGERGPNESGVAKVATWISGVALIVLLIACANVANLLLARALRRRREIAVRLALGVSGARLLSQLLTESILLALVGGVFGLLLAQWGGAVLRAEFLPKAVAMTVVRDTRTLAFAGAAALLAGLLTGLAPVFQVRRADLTNDLKSGAREGTYHRSRTGIALLVLQGALSVVLLVGAGLFVRSLRNVRAVPLGYDPDPVLLVNLNMRGVMLDSTQRVTLRRQLLEIAQSIPDVAHASRQLTVPMQSEWDMDLHVAGVDSVDRLGDFDLNAVNPDYFATMGTRILRGRGITDQDKMNAPRAMVVSAAMAATLWPGQDAIGRCVKIGSDTVPCTYVVGVSQNIKSMHLSNDAGLFYYLSAEQFHPDVGGLFVRVTGDVKGRAEAVRRRLQQLMPGASYVTVTPLGDIVGSQAQSWKLGATMFLVFGALALVLATIGLYSVIAYNVAQRTHELGVRVALGAQMGDLVRLVVNEGVKLGVIGIVIGGAIALVASRWMGPLLFGESPRDPAVFAFVAVLMLGVAALASFLPARRAARVDPNLALRAD